MESSFGGMLSMFGGESALEPLKEASVEVDILEKISGIVIKKLSNRFKIRFVIQYVIQM